MEFEAQVGPIVDPKIVNSAKGRVYLAHLCLRERQPDLTPGVIGKWGAEAWPQLWEMILEAIPIFDVGGSRPPAGPPAEAGAASMSSTSPRLPSSTAGHHPAPDGSE